MSRLMIISLSVFMASGCTAVQSSNSGTVQTESDIIRNETDAMQIEMVFVEGGTFIMGCTFEQRDVCPDDEKPAHLVTLSDFNIGKYPVTQAQWKSVMGTMGSDWKFKGESLPVDQVAWEEVQEFIKRLNKVTGRNYRLPTEAEWEYAARGGNESRGYKYSGSNNMDEVAWYGGDFKDSPHSVGTKKANELGIHDMSGNVYEWVNDWMQYYYTSIPQTNPQGPASGDSRVVRGGSWYDSAGSRVSSRGGDSVSYLVRGIGFRLAYGDQTDVSLSNAHTEDYVPQLKAVCEPDARTIVEKFFQFDFHGYRLSSKGHEAIWKLTWKNGEPAHEPIFVTKSYHVVSTEKYEDTCRVTVHFDIYGYIDDRDASNEKRGFVFQNSPLEKEETVVVRCLEKDDCRISMEKFNIPPHPGKVGIYKWLDLFTGQGTPLMEQEVRDLQEIIKALP